MAKDTQSQTRDSKGTMRMDEDGLRAYAKPRPLVESRPFCTDEHGQPLAMAADATVPRAGRQQPFVLEEPKLE